MTHKVQQRRFVNSSCKLEPTRVAAATATTKWNSQENNKFKMARKRGWFKKFSANGKYKINFLENFLVFRRIIWNKGLTNGAVTIKLSTNLKMHKLHTRVNDRQTFVRSFVSLLSFVWVLVKQTPYLWNSTIIFDYKQDKSRSCPAFKRVS